MIRSAVAARALRFARLLVALVVLVVVVVFAAPRSARADLGESAAEVGLALLYVAPVGCSAFAASANTAYLLADEGSPLRFRRTGYICGGVGIALGGYLLLRDGGTDSATDITIALVPALAGAAAILSGWLAGPERDLIGRGSAAAPAWSPWFVAGGGGVVFGGTF